MDQSNRAQRFLAAADAGMWHDFHRLFGPDVINAEAPAGHWRALDRCISHHYLGGVKALLDAKAEVNYHYGKYRMTPLNRASDFSQRDVVALLLQHRADVNARDREDWTAIHSVSDDEICRLLVENGADLNARDNKGRLPQYEGAIAYRRAFAACKLAQRAWLRIFNVHRRGVLVPDMVRLIGDMIWASRMVWK